MTLWLIEQLHAHARRAPDRAAYRATAAPDGTGAGAGAGAGPRVLSYAQLAASAEAVAARLARALPSGATVMLCMPNEPAFPVAFIGALSAGYKVFPASPEMTAAELASAAERSGAAAIIGTDEAVAALGGRVALALTAPEMDAITSDAPAPRDRAPAPPGELLLLSSGSTGRPKVVRRSGPSLDAVSRAMAEAVGFGADDDVLAAVPLCHSYGLEHGLLAPVAAGACVHLCRGFSLPHVNRLLTSGVDAGPPVSIFPGVPFMFEMLARHAHGAAFPRLRRAYSAGGPLPAAVAYEFRQRFGVAVSQLYGATEIGSVTYADPDLPGFNPASVGRPMRGVDVRILEDGQVAVKAESMLSGYVGEGEDVPPIDDGYFVTGDLGHVDEHGNLVVTGRLKSLIDVGGLKVNPAEVEAVIAQHPQVSACVVVPVRVSDTVSRVKAVVVPRDAADAPSADALRRFARQRLSGYKVPRLFEVRAALPRSAAGKVLRHLVDA